MTDQTNPSEKQWLDGYNHRKPIFPINGYAPGHYMGVCRKCKINMINVDKQAWHCFPCAVEDLSKNRDDWRKLANDIVRQNGILLECIHLKLSPEANELLDREDDGSKTPRFSGRGDSVPFSSEIREVDSSGEGLRDSEARPDLPTT
jgi:hypothetical protein